MNNSHYHMSFNFNLKEKVISVLKENPNKKFSAKEIVEEIILKYPDDCQKKKNNSLRKDINIKSQIAAEINHIYCDNVKIYNEERPKKYSYLTTNNVETKEIQNDNNNKKSEDFYKNEFELYSVLVNYLKKNDLYAKRIDEKKSSNKDGSGANKWLYPDVVAVENLVKDWNQTTIQCAKDYFIKKTKIYSYEVKKKINRSNIRECYFQAVSNSTWANFGYLVVTEIDKSANKELEILNALYGIGVIILKENPEDSYVYIQAKEREDLDWNIINRLVEENADFRFFIEKISDFYKNERSKTLEDISYK